MITVGNWKTILSVFILVFGISSITKAEKQQISPTSPKSSKSHNITTNGDIEIMEINVTYPKPTIKKITEEYVIIQVEGLKQNHFNPGEPLLPYAGQKILIPANKKIRDIQTKATKTSYLEGEYIIYPSQKAYKTFQNLTPTYPNATVYTQKTIFPPKIAGKAFTQGYRGHKILFMEVYPIQYLPTTKKILYHEVVNVKIILENQQQKKNR